ncbi:hypothetical protein CHUAL_002813 [Chamberlinius hualienensis]
MMSNMDLFVDFPPISYSSVFFPFVLRVAKEKGIDVTKFVNGEKCKKSKKMPAVQLTKYLPCEHMTQIGASVSSRQCNNNDISLLQLLALNALDLTAPAASDLLVRNRKNAWVQLSGHEGAFAPAGPGTIWKRRPADDNTEVKAYKSINEDIMRDLVPKFYKEVEYKSEYYIEMQDLLAGFHEPSVMDIKLGTRTFSESEVKNQMPRPDLYQKMVKVDPNVATEEERALGAITKLRYMDFREKLSSTSTLGFRIEAVKYGKMTLDKDLKLVKSRDQILHTFCRFFVTKERIRQQTLTRLKNMRKCLEQSTYFNSHEVVGSSILLIHDADKAGAWMIDFAKAFKLPDDVKVTHRESWNYGNHEDGYLTGLDNLISVIEDVGLLSTDDVKSVSI